MASATRLGTGAILLLHLRAALFYQINTLYSSLYLKATDKLYEFTLPVRPLPPLSSIENAINVTGDGNRAG